MWNEVISCSEETEATSCSEETNTLARELGRCSVSFPRVPPSDLGVFVYARRAAAWVKWRLLRKKWCSIFVWNSQGAVFYSHRSEWLWFADCRHIFYFSQKKWHFKRKKQLVQDLISPLSIYIHMCTLYTYTNMCMPIISPSGFFGSSRCLIPTPGLTSKYPICAVCVCVCVYTNTHPHTLPPASK